MNPPRTPIQTVFAQQFASWGLFLPDAVVAARADGWLLGEGWSVRWRWIDDGALQCTASHRMTNLRWQVIAADGAVAHREVPSEFMVFPKDASDEEKARIEAEYRAAWSAHGRALVDEGMEPIQSRPPAPAGLAGPGLQLWCAEGMGWAAAPLLTPA